MKFTERELKILEVSRRKWWGAHLKDFVQSLVQPLRKAVAGTEIPRPASRTTSPTLSKDLELLLERRVLRYEPPQAPGLKGVYIHMLAEAANALALRSWADGLIENVGRMGVNPTPRLTRVELRRYQRALRIRAIIDDATVLRLLDAIAQAGRPRLSDQVLDGPRQ